MESEAYQIKFQSFLSGRSQYTSTKESSNKLRIIHGVPQGSVLGPLLFILYISDLNKAIIHSYVHNFADDTVKFNIMCNSYECICIFMSLDLHELCNFYGIKYIILSENMFLID